MSLGATLPDRPPFVLRARLVTPLAAGATRHEPDGRLEVDAAGRIVAVGPWAAPGVPPASDRAGPPVIDLRPLVVLPGLVDLHAHLPQLPNAGVGAGLDLLTWLDRYIFPLERAFDAPTAERVAPAAFRAMAAAGTTTALMYGAVFEPSLDDGVPGGRGARHPGDHRQGDDGPADVRRSPARRSDPGDEPPPVGRPVRALARPRRRAPPVRIHAAVRPVLLGRHAARVGGLARPTGAYWQSHLSEDRDEIAEVARLFPEALDYVDVYDRAGGLGRRTVLAHAIHLSEREVARIAETGTALAHCPASNLFLASGAMPLARYRAAGIRVGLGSDVAAGPELSIFAAMRVGAYTQNGLRVLGGDGAAPPLGPLDWLRMGTLDGAVALGLADRIGSLEVGKEADLIAVDPRLVAPIPGRRLARTPRRSSRGSPSGRTPTWSGRPGSAGRRLEGPAATDPAVGW